MFHVEPCTKLVINIVSKKTPISLVTGFLGSGKTSLIKTYVKWIGNRKKLAFLINDIGEISVDAKLIGDVPFETYELSNGCICCSINENFKEALEYIYNYNNPDLIIVEASGTSNPIPILYSITNPNLIIDSVICVVDILNYPKFLKDTVFLDQISVSDVIYISKTDIAVDNQLEHAKKTLRMVNPKARLLSKNEIPPDMLFNSSKPSTLMEIPSSLEKKSHHLKDIDTFSLSFDKAFSYSSIDDALKQMPSNLWRIKGPILLEKKHPSSFILNYAFGRYSIEDSDYVTKNSILVFIGKHISMLKDTCLNIFMTSISKKDL